MLARRFRTDLTDLSGLRRTWDAPSEVGLGLAGLHSITCPTAVSTARYLSRGTGDTRPGGIDDHHVRHRPGSRRVSTDLLTMAQVAEHLGLSVRTIEAYRRDGRMPEAAMVGRTPTWTRAQIDAWQANRPGQGARTDLH